MKCDVREKLKKIRNISFYRSARPNFCLGMQSPDHGLINFRCSRMLGHLSHLKLPLLDYAIVIICKLHDLINIKIIHNSVIYVRKLSVLIFKCVQYYLTDK